MTMAESPLNEIELEVTERAKILEDVKISASIKLEIASAGMILDCCYIEAKAVMERCVDRGDMIEGDIEDAVAIQKEIALAIFGFLTDRMTQAAKQSQLEQPQIKLFGPGSLLSQS